MQRSSRFMSVLDFYLSMVGLGRLLIWWLSAVLLWQNGIKCIWILHKNLFWNVSRECYQIISSMEGKWSGYRQYGLPDKSHCTKKLIFFFFEAVKWRPGGKSVSSAILATVQSPWSLRDRGGNATVQSISWWSAEFCLPNIKVGRRVPHTLSPP